MWLVQVALLPTGYRIEVVGDGGVVRELGVPTGAPRSAGVRARRDAVLCRVTPARVDALLTADPAALRALTRLLATQLQAQTPSREGPIDLTRVVAVLGIGDGAPVQRFADELTRRLEQGMSVLTSRSLSPEQLHRAEPEHDRVLLVADDPRASLPGEGQGQAHPGLAGSGGVCPQHRWFSRAHRFLRLGRRTRTGPSVRGGGPGWDRCRFARHR